ncbi:choice-of-anchor R domain-containing protein [Streptomyces sp. NPDC127069]|uniref:choice-of-anchor R domain-containing protein n=1 Tax=Streptomyces sp. NPDC127069 TaxID=3347128 RepID=UPI00364F1B8D
MMRTRSVLAATALLTTLLHAADGAAAAAAAGGLPAQSRRAAPDRQAGHAAALAGIGGAGNAGAQEFTTSAGRLDRVSLYLSSGAAAGKVRVQVRAVREDPGSAVADAVVDLASLGGPGAGWVEVPLSASVSPGSRYWLFAQATTAGDQPVVWYGTSGDTAGGPEGARYDGGGGGWRESGGRFAFYVNPSGPERCGEVEACYVPASLKPARTAGLLADGHGAVEAVEPAFAVGARYVPGSNVLELPSGRWRYLPTGSSKSRVVGADDPAALAQIAESRRWLASGTVPGGSGARREGAERALLSMRALLRPNGAFAAAWYPFWDFSWPRDSAFAAAAFAHTGHDEEAYRILRYNAGTQRPDGTWEARTRLDGSGPPDDRRWQLDANGWVPWAAWQWYRTAPAAGRAERLRALYPALAKAADFTAGSLDAEGLPPASPDYWELPTATANIGTAAPLLAGLNAAADLASELGRDTDAGRWAQAARRLEAGIAKRFAPLGYGRTADGLHGRDSAAAFMAPPFNTAPADLPRALDDTYRELRRPNGGLVPGSDPDTRWGNITWTASTSFFALAWTASGERAKGDAVLDWVLDRRNLLGELPETVDAQGLPKAVVPLGWTDALVLLTLTGQEGRGPETPPGPRT